MNNKLALKYVDLFLFYRSPSQVSDILKNLRIISTLDTLTESNSHVIVALGDFNVKSKNWYTNDKSTTEGAKIEFVTSQFGLHQIINEPTHVLVNSSLVLISFLHDNQT